MPDTGHRTGPGASGSTVHCYVYYRVAESELGPAVAAVLPFQQALAAEHPTLRTSLMRRPASSEGLVTLMETYQPLSSWPQATPGVPADATALRERLRRGPLGLQGLLRGERHLEEFVPCA